MKTLAPAVLCLLLIASPKDYCCVNTEDEQGLC